MIAKTLKEYRKLNGLTQQQIAQILGLDRSTYAYYENGKHSPSLEVLSALSRIYNVSIDTLLGNNDVNFSIFEDAAVAYNNTIKSTSEKDKYLSKISKSEQDALLLFRLIHDKTAAIAALNAIYEQEKE